ncbi:dTDP-4-dehydrorhamnose 3,5-epimerase [Bacteroidetes bacterium endosymbiont of Geopemphigus sp.]|uniref:dTDP-4-dehydrorhamnose 3,5-epimerase n=1 Tax=Bacteroidetes bacterium endosymbiont of Geopemphigus sp. TaxID=2047937 RepID=UPI000CD302B0|nr:dTDP-4-dehydrorhamnose 3,5-epimerase [Bacteroidetes bacterium endosymbiont of Geopemphigus sp.]
MEILSNPLEGFWILKSKIIEDSRGHFQESFHQEKFERISDQKIVFVQTNRVFSLKGALRGLHLQRPPHTQSKLISVLSGEILDVALDVRLHSCTYGKYIIERLSYKNQKQLFLAKGFAHGFITLSDQAEVLYQCDAHYHCESEDGICYDDPQLAINWEYPIKKIILSEKDRQKKAFKDFTPVSL